jgi:hypothetical protein
MDITPESLPKVALESLLNGAVSESLAALAGAVSADTPSELRSLFEQAIRELNVDVPSRLVAATLLKREYARRVVDGLISPRSGAAEIVNLYRIIESELPKGGYVGEAFGISEIVGAYYSYDDVDSYGGTSVAESDNWIRTACRVICDESTP